MCDTMETAWRRFWEPSFVNVSFFCRDQTTHKPKVCVLCCVCVCVWLPCYSVSYGVCLAAHTAHIKVVCVCGCGLVREWLVVLR